MTKKCKYKQSDGSCYLLSSLRGNRSIPDDKFCRIVCSPEYDTWRLRCMKQHFDVTANSISELEKQIEEGVVQTTDGKKPANPKYKRGCGSCGKIKNIVKGFGKLTWERVSNGRPDDETIRRAEICAKCEHRTFLPVTKWAIGSIQSGDLPVNHEPGQWDALWCSKCKCCIEAKIRVLEEKCPVGKWKGDE